MPLESIKELYFPVPRVYQCDNGWVEVRYVEASRVKFLNRSDDTIGMVPILFGGRKPIALGAISEAPVGVYRIIAFGQIPTPADESLEYERQAAIDSLYNYHVEGTAAKKRVGAIAQSDAMLMATF